MFNNSYQPFTTLFLLPDEIKADCTSLNDLIKNKSIITGDFSLETPKTALGFQSELQKMKLASLGQIKFLNLMALSKKLQKLNVLSNDSQSAISEAPKKRGRPVKKPDDNQAENLESKTERRLKNHDCQFAINFIDTSASEKMHSNNEEFKSLLGKRNIDIAPFVDEQAKLNSQLVDKSLKIILGLKSRIEAAIKAHSTLTALPER